MTPRPWWFSKRWAALLLGAVLLLVMQLLGASADVCTPLAWGVGAALSGEVKTIEGNTGDAVRRRSYHLDDDRIVGFFRWPLETA